MIIFNIIYKYLSLSLPISFHSPTFASAVQRLADRKKAPAPCSAAARDAAAISTPRWGCGQMPRRESCGRRTCAWPSNIIRMSLGHLGPWNETQKGGWMLRYLLIFGDQGTRRSMSSWKLWETFRFLRASFSLHWYAMMTIYQVVFPSCKLVYVTPCCPQQLGLVNSIEFYIYPPEPQQFC